MQTLFITAALLSVALEGPTAAAQVTPTGVDGTAAPAAAAKPTKICKTIPMIGSRLSKKRFCGTPEEWAERKRDDREAVDKMQSQVCVINGTTCK